MWREIKYTIGVNRGVSEQTVWIRDVIIKRLPGPIAEQVFLSGTSSNSTSSAFWCGYQSAIQMLFGRFLNNEIASIVVNEHRSFKPSDWITEIEKKSEAFVLVGKKDFITAPDQIDLLLVAANEQGYESKASKLCKVKRNIDGLSLVDLNMPVFKDLKKSKGVFSRLELAHDEVLPGDGYDWFVKPFRVVEDFYVSLSMLGYLIKILMKHELDLTSFIPRLTLVLNGISSAEQELNCYIANGGETGLFLETFIKEVGENIQVLMQYFKDNGALKDYQQDMMIFKIGEKARDIRYQRALSKELEVSIS
ncbi:hypothetical protein [Litoribrevibacter albus]|uniref:Uncharacterized protein n=1 Tax=Litoribrevibacter albus TaxID=1473156 RepID=A0AA37SA69_9GAMM|nr:hypothetical protein [Litoribrevibacter albus]GLQ30962.1 hypothetical protein GCM10007876_14410 [Litoribrevibacter albus]